MEDTVDELIGAVAKMEKLKQDCHRHHVDLLVAQFQEPDDAVTAMARDFGENNADIDGRLGQIESCDPWHGFKTSKQATKTLTRKHDEQDDDEGNSHRSSASGRGHRGDKGEAKEDGERTDPSDYFSKCRQGGFACRDGTDGPSKSLEWPEKAIAYLSGRKRAVASWRSWASTQRGKLICLQEVGSYL